MGRGRAKAKQTKVARELKYSTHETDLERLQRELAGGSGDGPAKGRDGSADDEVDGDDRWASAGS
ncbi:MAG: DUF3073 domain-containing protein [Actinomycetota bacterium]|nr:DUF3073 domain-containing protein [Actinomycetota bacterium]